MEEHAAEPPKVVLSCVCQPVGIHLIELYSGRLAIGSDQYRKLTRKRNAQKAAHEATTIDVAVVGARGSGRSSLIAALTRARTENLAAVRGRLEADGFDPNLADLLTTADWVEVPGYTVHEGKEVARDRSTRRHALERAVKADLVLLTIDATRDDVTPDVHLVTTWDEFFASHATLEAPPVIVVLTGIDKLAAANGSVDSASLIQARVESLRKALPKSVIEIVSVSLGNETPVGVAEQLLVGLAPLLERAERVAMIRRMQDVTARSKARRLIGQIGTQGKRLFSSLRGTRRK